MSSMPLIFGHPLWLVFALARAAGQRLRNSVSARSLRIAPAFGSMDTPLPSNGASPKNDDAGTVRDGRTSGPMESRAAAVRRSARTAADAVGGHARGRIRTGDPRLVRAML